MTTGHGGSVRDASGDEADSLDETMVPVDYQQTGQITDDEILKAVSQPQLSEHEALFFSHGA